MTNVRVGFFSFTEVTEPGEHRAYNEWHMLDHMPEQFPLPGVAGGQRWVSTPAGRAARTVSAARLDPVHYVTLYLMTEPVDDTLRDFHALGGRLRALGRFHEHRRSHLSGPFELLDTHAAPRVRISAAAVPWRPMRGVYVTVDEVTDRGAIAARAAWEQTEAIPRALELPGVAGVWRFATSPRFRGGPWEPGHHRIAVWYLDDDPLAVAPPLADALAVPPGGPSPYTPVLHGPFETITPGEWDWFGSS